VRQPGSVEVLAGLSAGERVIVEGTQKVRDGAAVQGSERAADITPLAGDGESHEASLALEPASTRQ
jgi:hypothetical protein